MRQQRFMQRLTSNVHLYTAKIEKTPIIVFIEQELVGNGVIEDITEISVKVKGEHYMRDVCTFKYAN